MISRIIKDSVSGISLDLRLGWYIPLYTVTWLFWISQKPHSKLGNSSKYPFHTTDGFHILTTLMPSEFHNRHPPPPLVQIFYIFMKPFEIICRVHNMPNLAYFKPKYFEWLFFCIQYSCMVTEGVTMTLGNKIVKRMKVLSLGACSTRHATYINFSLLQTGTSTCDERVYTTLKIFRSSGRSSFHFRQLEIEPLGSAVTPNSTVGASYMVSKYQLKGMVGEKTMLCIDWTILCRRLFLRERKRMFCSINASGAWFARHHLFYFCILLP